MRNGPKGEFQFTPIPAVMRGLGELPRKSSRMLELGWMSRMFGDCDNLVVTIDKADLAIGDFSRLRVQVSN